MKEKVFVFAALPYVNSSLHLGHVAGAYLPYDVFRRFLKLRGYDVISTSGSDEHGTPITVKSIREGIPPEEIVEKYHKLNVEIFRKMNIEFDAYIETSSKLHKEITSNFLKTLKDKGFIYEAEMVQPFCVKENIFLADRYVRGKCPYCGYEEATGDQCENCGRTLEPSELINPVCIFDLTTPEFRQTKHLFFRLSSLQADLSKYIDSRVGWRQNVLNFSRNFITNGLKDRPITRDLNWGVDVPFPGYENKKIYVWFEALIGYLTGISSVLGSQEDALAMWRNPGLKYYHFVGKDNIVFHSIVWPGMLLAHGDMTLPYQVAANEFLNFRGEKFSKSKGTGFSMIQLLERYNSEFIRFGVLYNLPEEHDADFSIEEFENRVNTELIDKFGNFVNRALILAYKKGPISIDQIAQNDLDIDAEKTIRNSISTIISEMDSVHIRNAFRTWLDLAYYGNSFITNRKPWDQCKKDDANCNAAIYTGVKIVFALAVSGQMFLPETSKKILSWLGYSEPIELKEDLEFPVSRLTIKPDRLFEKIVNNDINLRLQIAQVMGVNDHPNAEKLYLLDLDLGDSKRRIVSGIKNSYTKESLNGKKIVVVTNLKPALIRGETSNGMLLAAEDENGIHLVLAPESAKNGEEVKIGDMQTDPSEISIEKFRKFILKTARRDSDVVPAIFIDGKQIFLETPSGRLKLDGSPSEGLIIK
ncbi:MAG: methionine--tRNA ligase [Thermoplasmata archaeon]